MAEITVFAMPRQAAGHPDSAASSATVEQIGGQPDSAWVVSVMGGAPHKLRENAAAASTSPDGSTIAFLTNGITTDSYREIWLMDTNGEHARKLYETGENSNFGFPNWSPDGRRLLYQKIHRNGDKVG
jgi:dipeptidyl aminopeptidase/acylaminoacyl peptidase